MRVLIVSENASMRMSGETQLALFYFAKMRARGIEPYVLTHARCRDELRETHTPEDFERFYFIEDTSAQAFAWRSLEGIPERMRALLLGQAIHLSTQLRSRDLARELVPKLGIDVVFEPSPIATKGVSAIYDVGAPVVVGPLCGGLEFPPAFKYMDSRAERVGIAVGRRVSPLVHRALPGKLKADVVLVGSQRSARALPEGVKGRVLELPESGMDLDMWRFQERPEPGPGEPVRFVFVARFVDWKGIEFLVDAFARVSGKVNAVLELVGDGELFEAMQRRVRDHGIGDTVNFHGRQPPPRTKEIVQASHAYVAPALRECGGCAMLEAMALGMPVVAANWMGPGEFLDGGVGMLVEPTSREALVAGLADAMTKLALDPELRRRLSHASAQRARERYYDWDSKTDRLLEIFRETIGQA